MYTIHALYMHLCQWSSELVPTVIVSCAVVHESWPHQGMIDTVKPVLSDINWETVFIVGIHCVLQCSGE